MKKFLFAALVLSVCGGALAQAPLQPAPSVTHKAGAAVALCDSCGTVQEVKQEQRKGKGGAAGIIGGAVVGGLLGHQIGKGTGNTVATVGGAAAGGFVGNEVQKKVTSKNVWVTRVKMKDGSIRTFEQETQPAWTVGSRVKATGKGLRKL